MKRVFLYSKHHFPIHLEKINASLYYDLQTDTFYRLNIMPTCTTFVTEDVEERQVISLTKYDPTFHMIGLLYADVKIKAENIPHYLQKRNWNSIATVENINQHQYYSFNRQKTFDFLEKKVQRMQKYFEEKNPLDRLQIIKPQHKTISPDSIVLLKNEISGELVSQFVKERYNLSESRKIAPQPQQNQVLKPKIVAKGSKKASSTKQNQISKNQSTLFSWTKK